MTSRPSGAACLRRRRERVAELLRDALAEGRLDMEEFEERLDAAYKARTLRGVGAARPGPAGARRGGGPRWAPPRPPRWRGRRARAGPARIVGGDGHVQRGRSPSWRGFQRKGRWTVRRRFTAFAFWGGGEIDLREAYFADREVVDQLRRDHGRDPCDRAAGLRSSSAASASWAASTTARRACGRARRPRVIVTGSRSGAASALMGKRPGRSASGLKEERRRAEGGRRRPRRRERPGRAPGAAAERPGRGRAGARRRRATELPAEPVGLRPAARTCGSADPRPSGSQLGRTPALPAAPLQGQSGRSLAPAPVALSLGCRWSPES